MFVHLRLHTEFSVVDGTNRIDEVAKAAARDGQPALAITDFNNLFGAIKFYKETRGKGVKPILGAEVLLEGEGSAAPSRLIVLVQNRQGYLNLSELLARAKTAEAQNKVHDAVRSIDVMDPTSEIGRFEDKVRRQEALAAGKAEIAASSLDAQFNQLEDVGELTEVEARLAALKTGGSSAAAIER